MLSGYSAEIVAYLTVDDGGFVCRDCLSGTPYCDLAISKIDIGMGVAGVDPITRYALEDYEGIQAYEQADSDPNIDLDDPDTWPREPCCKCGKVLDPWSAPSSTGW